MKRALIATACLLGALAVGAMFGARMSQRIAFETEFARTMQLSLLVNGAMTKVPRQQIIAGLLDVYEDAVRHTSSVGLSTLDWQQELMKINLQRYVLRTAEHRNDLAERALVTAATIKKGGQAPTQADIEFYRELANRLYSAPP